MLGVNFVFIKKRAIGSLILSPILNTLLQLGLSRSMEFLADYDAATITRDPLGLASALQKIENMSRSWWNIFIPVPNKSVDWLSSHPSMIKRIDKLRAMMRPQEDYILNDNYNVERPRIIFNRRPLFWM